MKVIAALGSFYNRFRQAERLILVAFFAIRNNQDMHCSIEGKVQELEVSLL